MSERLNLTYAIKDGNLTHISEVERGLKCGCVCPACHEVLIARKGKKMMHHFAHKSTENCAYGYETSLHLAAKEILAGTKKIIIPGTYVKFYSHKQTICLSKSTEVTIEKVQLEHRFRNVIPDVIIYVDGKPLFIEIFVTHPIDDEKLDKLKELGISTIEIDLSSIDHSVTTEELSDILLKDNELKYWKYNALSDDYKKRFYDTADIRSVTWKFGFPCVYKCPIYKKDNKYADLIEDCNYCEYCIASYSDYILCSGRQRISSIEDLNRPDIKQGKDFSQVTEPVIKKSRRIPLTADNIHTTENPLATNTTNITNTTKIIWSKNSNPVEEKSVIDKEFYSSDPWVNLFKQMDDDRKKMKTDKINSADESNEPVADMTSVPKSTIAIAKSILTKAKTIVLPPVYLHCDEQKTLLKSAQTMAIDHVELNHQIGRDIFDAVIHNSTESIVINFFIEEHMDEEHLDIIRALHIPVLEIDLSKADQYVTIKNFTFNLLNSNKLKHWICHPDADKYL